MYDKRQYQAAYRASPEGRAARAAHRRLYKKRPEVKARNAARMRRQRLRSPELREKQWVWHLNRKYGMTPDQYGALLIDQGGCCRLCRRPPGKKWLHVDHDHSKVKGQPGFLRGLLCDKCNIGLGSFRDNPTVLRLAAEYIEAHK